MKTVLEPGCLRSDAWFISITPKFRISGILASNQIILVTTTF